MQRDRPCPVTAPCRHPISTFVRGRSTVPPRVQADLEEKAHELPPRLGRHRFTPAKVQVLASDDLSGSLRKLKTVPQVAVDRFKSLQQRGVVQACHAPPCHASAGRARRCLPLPSLGRPCSLRPSLSCEAACGRFGQRWIGGRRSSCEPCMDARMAPGTPARSMLGTVSSRPQALKGRAGPEPRGRAQVTVMQHYTEPKKKKIVTRSS